MYSSVTEGEVRQGSSGPVERVRVVPTYVLRHRRPVPKPSPRVRRQGRPVTGAVSFRLLTHLLLSPTT